MSSLPVEFLLQKSTSKMAGIGKLFKFGSKKPPEPPRSDYEGRDQGTDYDEDEYGYMDPAACHSVLPPSTRMPNYPPPRPNHSNISPKPGDSSYRIQQHNPGDGYKPHIKPRSIKMQRSAEGSLSKAVDDYCDPWDAKQHQIQVSSDDYCEPMDVTKPSPQPQERPDDYSDPWNSRPGQKTKPRATKAGLKDEYIDPWDAKGPQNPNQVKCDSDDESYSEPYDSGKVTALDEQAKRMSLRGMRLPSASNTEHDHYTKPQTQSEDNRPSEDYESPWESKNYKGLVLPSQTAAKKTTLPKSGQMPVSDSRPCEDYDKPWEWAAAKQTRQYVSSQGVQKTKTLPKAEQIPVSDTRPCEDYDKPWEWAAAKHTKQYANGQITQPKPSKPQSTQAPVGDSRPEQDYDAPWEYNKRSSQLVSIAQEQATPQKPSRTDEDHERTFHIDTSLPIEKQSWYHGPITRVEAECLLKYEDDCSFLVRDSESSKRDYSLSFKINKAFIHLKISLTPQGKYVLGQFSLPYDKVPQIIDHYSCNKLNIRGTDHSYLKNPVSPRHDYFVLEKH